MSILQCLRIYFRITLEGFSQLIQIHFVVFNLIARGKSLTTHERQTAIKRQITTLAIEVSTLTRASTFTFCPPTASFPLPSRNTASDAFSILFGARIGHKIV